MRRSIVLLTVAMLAAHAWPAAGWDAEREEPIVDPAGFEPVSADSTPDRTPVAPPDGVYLVTDVYAGDFVVHDGPLTTYTTETVHEITGSYARVLEVVGTGDASTFDGASFNGRASLADGRPVAGTYYENFILAENGFVPVSVVFFQDDSELARASTPSGPTPALAAPTPIAVALPSIAPIEVPIERSDGPVVGYVTPISDDDRVIGPDAPTIGPASGLLPSRAIEVLRGRRISLLFSGMDVRGWRALSTEGIALGPLSGTTVEPFVVRWDRLAPPNTTWVSRFLIDYANGTSHELVVYVSVRAPGLVE